MASPYNHELTANDDGMDQLPEALWRHYMHDAAARLGQLGVAAGSDVLADSDGQEHVRRPDGLHRVGVIDFGDGVTREALLPGLGEAHVALPGDAQRLPQSIAAARSLVMQMLESRQPGQVSLSVYNGHLTDAMGGFSELGALFESVPPGELNRHLDWLARRHSRLATHSIQVGSGNEPWHISVIIDRPDHFEQRQLTTMNQLVAAGPQYGSLITIGADLRPSPQLRGNWPTDRVRPYAVRYDPGPSRGTVASKCAAIAAEARKGSASPELSSIMQGEFWQQTSHEGLTVPLGINVATNNVHAITIGDETPHAILTGQSGGGKSNVLNTLIASLAYQFNPDELQINLLDYKQGVEFARYGAHPYLPHANIVGKKIDDDPEFGLAALRYLEKEIARRGGRSNEMGFTNFIELHDDPEKSWPRIVMVIDEFHKLLENGHGNEAAERMLNIVRQGRSMGVHLVLATQNVKGIASLADKYDALFTNIPMRMATVGGSMMRKDHKTDIAHSLPTHHLLVGTNSGDTESDITLWMPDSSSPSRGKPAVAAIQRRAYDAYQEKCRKDKVEPDRPFVYNSLTVPVVTASREFQALSRVDLSPRILLAQEIDVTDRTAGLRLNREPGSNVAVIGNASRRREVYGVLHSAALSLAKQQSPNQARFTVVCLDRQAATAVDATAASLRDMGHKGVEVVRPENAPAFFASAGAALDPHTEQSHYLLVYGADASQVIMSKPSEIEHAIDVGDMELNASEGTKVSAGITVLASDIKSRKSIKAAASGTVRKRGDDMVIVEQGPSGKESFFKLLSEGPGNGVHVIASYSSAASLKQAVTQGVAHQQAQHVGSYVAVGVQPMELNAFSPENPYTVTAIEGLDRRNRGIFYTRGKAPHFVRLFAGPALSDDEEED